MTVARRPVTQRFKGVATLFRVATFYSSTNRYLDGEFFLRDNIAEIQIFDQREVIITIDVQQIERGEE